MTCRECAEFLAEYLDGTLPADVVATFEHHLGLCPNCVTYLRQYEATIHASKAAFADEPAADPDFPEELIRAIRAARRG